MDTTSVWLRSSLDARGRACFSALGPLVYLAFKSPKYNGQDLSLQYKGFFFHLFPVNEFRIWTPGARPAGDSFSKGKQVEK